MLNKSQPAMNLSDNSCVIFLFTPKKISDHVIRPLTYNFNEKLVRDIHDVIDNKKREDAILNSNVGNTSIVPNAIGIQTKTSLLSDKWSFVMIVDQEKNQLVDMNTPNRFMNMRFIYTGYCSDEPILPHTMNLTNIVINPQSKLIITRKVVINKLKYHIDSYGSHTKEDVLCDILVAKYDNRLVNNDLFSLFPGKAIEAVNIEDNVSTLDIGDSLGVKDNLKISSKFQSPKSHLRSIMGSIVDGVEEIVMADKLGSYSNDYNSMAIQNDYIDDIAHNNIITNLAYNGDIDAIDTDGIFGINSSDNLFLQDVKNHYNPDIYIIRNTTNEQLSIIPQNHISIESVFSSLISTCIPSYAINTKLSSVSFWYDSYKDIVEPYNFDSPTVITQQELLNNWNAFMYLFRKELVPILKDNGGEFNVLVNCVTNGSTYVKLSFNDNGNVYGHDDYFENSSIPGGLTTNMIGSSNVLTNNGSMLNNLSNSISSGIFSNMKENISLDIL